LSLCYNRKRRGMPYQLPPKNPCLYHTKYAPCAPAGGASLQPYVEVQRGCVLHEVHVGGRERSRSRRLAAHGTACRAAAQSGGQNEAQHVSTRVPLLVPNMPPSSTPGHGWHDQRGRRLACPTAAAAAAAAAAPSGSCFQLLPPRQLGAQVHHHRLDDPPAHHAHLWQRGGPAGSGGGSNSTYYLHWRAWHHGAATHAGAPALHLWLHARASAAGAGCGCGAAAACATRMVVTLLAACQAGPPPTRCLMGPGGTTFGAMACSKVTRALVAGCSAWLCRPAAGTGHVRHHTRRLRRRLAVQACRAWPGRWPLA